MRCEPNISIKPKGQVEFGTKTEIKNLNSFRAVYMGVDYELKRQEKVLRHGDKVIQETRRWDDSRGVTATMRTKEVEQEYRYFPEPDLVPMIFGDEWVEKLRSELPELPLAKVERFEKQYGLSESDAEVLVESPELASFYDDCAKCSKDPKAVANWVTGEFLRLVNATGISIADTKLTPGHICGMLDLIDTGTINRNIAKTVFEDMFNTGKQAVEIVKEKALEQVTDTGAIEAAIDKVIAAHPKEVERFKGGEEKLIGFFVGQVMRESKGKANPGVVNKILKDKLQS